MVCEIANRVIIIGLAFIMAAASIPLAIASPAFAACRDGTYEDCENHGGEAEPYEVKVDPPICEITVVSAVGHSQCRERGEGTDDFGPGIPADGDAWGCSGAGASSIAYINGKSQNGEYAYVPAMEHSKVGDHVRLCLVSFLADCPRGDDRGITYTAENLRTHGRWRKPNASHMCGGA